MRKLSGKQQRFIAEYLVDLNATQAALRAGYGKASASSTGYENLRNPQIAKEIREKQRETAARLEADADQITERWLNIARADPNELTAIMRGACRYCHGKDHGYQWRIEAEYRNAVAAYLAMSENKRPPFPPEADGGYGYSPKREPHPDCPMCDGDGQARIRIGDTTDLSPQARLLFAGVKETQHGIEIKMHDQMHAVDQVARRLNLFADDNRDDGMTDLAAALLEISNSGSAAPIAKPPKENDHE